MASVKISFLQFVQQNEICITIKIHGFNFTHCLFKEAMKRECYIIFIKYELYKT